MAQLPVNPLRLRIKNAKISINANNNLDNQLIVLSN